MQGGNEKLIARDAGFTFRQTIISSTKTAHEFMPNVGDLFLMPKKKTSLLTISLLSPKEI
jgi:hypothetical protein